MNKNVAIVLAGGSGSRMQSKTKKQYLLIENKPVLYYSLEAFQSCPFIHEIVLVCGKNEAAYCKEEFVDAYGFSKVTQITEGGAERYLSVYEGLKVIRDCQYVLVHDGARPFVDEEILDRLFRELEQGNPCVAAVPVKDTIKMSDSDQMIAETLPRERLWSIQTPQAFEYRLLKECYDKILTVNSKEMKITDDAMVVESISNQKIRLVEGSYENIKITTPEDMMLAELIVKKRKKKIGEF